MNIQLLVKVRRPGHQGAQQAGSRRRSGGRGKGSRYLGALQAGKRCLIEAGDSGEAETCIPRFLAGAA